MTFLASARGQHDRRRDDRAERGVAAASATCHGTAPLVPPSDADVAEDHAGPGARGRVDDVDVAEVADALRQRVRGEVGPSGRSGSAAPVALLPVAPGCPGRRSRRRAGPGPRARVKLKVAVVVREALVVDELRAGGVVQRDAAGLHVRSGPKARPCRCTVCGALPVLVTVTGQLSLVPGGRPRSAGWPTSAGSSPVGAASRRRLDRLGQLDRLVAVRAGPRPARSRARRGRSRC